MRIILLIFIIFLEFGLSDGFKMSETYAKYYHKKLPLRVDFHTTLVDLQNISMHLFYRYHINDTIGFAITKFDTKKMQRYKNELLKKAIKDSCSDREVVKMLQYGIFLEHGFYTQNGQLLFSFIIDKKSCGI